MSFDPFGFSGFSYGGPSSPRTKSALVLAVNEVGEAQQVDAGDSNAAAAGTPSVPTSDEHKVDAMPRAETDQLLGRLPEIKEQETDKVAWNKRAASVKAPKTGDIIPQPFPPPVENRPQVEFKPEDLKELAQEEAGELAVTRFAPAAGNIEHALSTITISFNQPMVSLSSNDDVAMEMKDLPISMEPAVAGRWRWTGTQTVQFEAEHRLPYSTEFTVTVEQGCKSQLGAELPAKHTWTFRTRTLHFSSFIISPMYKSWVSDLDATMLLRFDQLIEPEHILENLEVSCITGTRSQTGTVPDFKLIACEQAEAKFGSTINKQWLAGTWMCVGFNAPLEKATSYTVSVKPGTRSAEGPLATPEPLTKSFKTYEPLRVTSQYPKPDTKTALPGCTWTIDFNNVLNASTATKDMFTTQPVVPNLKVRVSGSSVTLYQDSKAETTYALTIRDGLKDVYGQSLEQNGPLTFPIGEAAPLLGSLQGPSHILTMDPEVKEPFYPVMVYNYPEVKVTIHQVAPSDYGDSKVPMTMYEYSRGKASIPGNQVHTGVIKLDVERDTPYEFKVNLAPHLQHPKKGLGHVIVVVEPTEEAFKKCSHKGSDYRYRPVSAAWVQCTRLGIDVFGSHGKSCFGYGWLTDLATGKPIANGQLSCGWTGGSTTDQHGLAKVTLRNNTVFVARQDDDISFLSKVQANSNDDDRWQWHVFDDRHLYKPNETVNIKGYIRRVQLVDDAMVPQYASGEVQFQVYDPRGQQFKGDCVGKVKLNDYGAFNFSFTLPDNVNLGNVQVRMSLSGGWIISSEKSVFRHQVLVQEFRRPEFEVSVSHFPVSDHYASAEIPQHVVCSARGKLFAGGDLSDATVSWRVSASPTSYSPPVKEMGWFSFGTPANIEDAKSVKHRGTTDADGEHQVDVSYHGVDAPPQPYTITAVAAVQDLNHQTRESSTSFLVHPSQYYVGYQCKARFAEMGKETLWSVVVTDVKGNLVPNVDVGVYIKGTGRVYREDAAGLLQLTEVTDEQKMELRSAGDGPVEMKFKPQIGGTYRLEFTVTDPTGRINQSTNERFYVAGGYEKKEKQQIDYVPCDELTLVADKDAYQPGDVADVLIVSPFTPAEGVAFVVCGGIVGDPIPFSLGDESNSYTLKVPISEKWLPGATIRAQVTGQAGRVDNMGIIQPNAPPRPAVAAGSVKLAIPIKWHALRVNVTPRLDTDVAAPGRTVRSTVVVTDIKDQPVGGVEVAFVCVDESVLSLTGHEPKDPLHLFYTERREHYSVARSRSTCLLVNATDVEQLKADMLAKQETARRQQQQEEEMAKSLNCCCAGFGGGGSWGCNMDDCLERCCLSECAPQCARSCCSLCCSAPGAPPAAGGAAPDNTPIGVRSNFDALASFAPHVVTDAQGTATVEVVLPDNLTKYRVYAVACTDTKFGMGQNTLVVQLPVMVRPSPPRFLNFGDEAKISVVLQNQTDVAQDLQIAMRATNATVKDPGFKFRLGATKRAVVSFMVDTKEHSAGTARFQFAVSAKGFADAAEVSIPIYTPATTEAFATYGTVAEKSVVFQPVQAPADVFPQFGGLEISTSSTQLQALTDAVLYLWRYPYECSEQISSRFLGILSLLDVLTAFGSSELPSALSLATHLQLGFRNLRGRQYPSGGFGMWSLKYEEQLYMSVHVTHMLVVAKNKKFTVPRALYDRAIAFISDMKRQISVHKYGRYYSEATKAGMRAYAAYVVMKSGRKDSKLASDIMKEFKWSDLNLETLAWLLSVLSTEKLKNSKDIKKIMDHFKSNVTETADVANFITSYGDNGQLVMLHSSRRTDASILDAFLYADPMNSLVPKVAKGLLAHRKKGRWGSTQENCVCLIALDHYFRVYEKDVPDFDLQLWFDDQFAGQQTFKGRSVDTNQLDIPMADIVKAGKADIIMHKKGTGRLYYRLGLNYAPLSLELKPANYGFLVTRKYSGLEDADDAKLLDDGSWQFKVGKKIKVELTMTTVRVRYHVALVDYLPAGLEPLNPDLKDVVVPAKTSTQRYNPFSWRFYSRKHWPEHQNLRDERAEAFRSLLWPGEYEWSYTARATTKGTFVAPPAKAEEMYSPENFGRTGTAHVVVA